MAKVIPINSIECPECEGKGSVVIINAGQTLVIDCPTCDGKGWVFEEDPDLLNDAY